MPTPQDAQPQPSAFGPTFDPDVIMQEIANKDVMLQMKEQELAQREQALQGQTQPQEEAQPEQQEVDPEDQKFMEALNLLSAGLQERQQQRALVQQQQATPPVVPIKDKQAPAQNQQQAGPDVSAQTMQNVQPGQEVVITKRIVMTPEGPMEISRKEDVKKGKEQKQQKPQAQAQ